ncbi:hypothetical protein MHA02_15720 [Methylobacterium haplocladii]|uniref:Peptidoglycan binding-like domain-containing protein n=1 Tax=Methylobacterium haplocladii TaxID=1176176 RepID=A0A512IN92_9HYPH|nr:hypothetical protein MHA02_15720 [Methylobacterium haplocladii]
MSLIAAGLQNAVPTERFQMTTFNAIQAFQASNSLAATGYPDAGTLDRLSVATRPLFDQWGFREVPHPYRGRPIWIPQGMGLRPIPNSNGVSFRDPDERLEIHYNYFAGKYIDKEYFDTLQALRSKGAIVHYSVMKDDWYVISSTSPQGIDAYRRYHIDGTGILGFTEFWNNARGNLNGERIAILMSASLGSAMGGRLFVDPGSVGGFGSPSPHGSPPPTYTPPPGMTLPPSSALSAGDKLRVVSVASNDALSVRELPDQLSKVVGIIPPDGRGIDFDGDRKGSWLFVRYDRIEGWVPSQFVVSEPPPLKKGRKLDDGE